MKKLTTADREVIENLLQHNFTVQQIADELGKHRSTIYREIKNRGAPFGYFAKFAQANRDSKKKLSKKSSLKLTHKDLFFIIEQIQRGWSPEQISGYISLHPSLFNFTISHEKIYQLIYENEYCIKLKIHQYLRYGRRKRRKRYGRKVRKSKIPNRVSISERPNIDGEFGHWEGDSVIFAKKKAINTLNERKSGLVKFTKLERKTAELTEKAIVNQLCSGYARTLTLDNGSEFTKHEGITEVTGVKVYFCDPYSSWQRGANENVNMLLRCYLPKGTNIDKLTQKELDDIALEINTRPKKRLGYRSSLEIYQEEILKLSKIVAIGN